MLPCGCLAGVYETYGGAIVTVIDARSIGCADPTHADGKIVPDEKIPGSAPARRHGTPSSQE